MKISVVITTYNRRSSLERTLASLTQQTFPPDQCEIVVVGDGCTDDTLSFLHSFRPPCGFTFVEQPNQGQPAAQNSGVAAATGDLVLFMDDDCICDPGLVAAHCEAHNRGPNFLVTGVMLVHPDSPPGSITELKRELAEADVARLSSVGARRMDMMLCANSSIARQAVLDEPFDPTYKRIHDVEQGIRLWDRGVRPVFEPTAVAREIFAKSADGILRDANYQGQFEVSLTRAHPDFKPYSGLARINEGSPVKVWARKQLALHSVFSERVLRAAYSISESLRRTPSFAVIARRTMQARVGLAHLSGAIREAGSWPALEAQFGKRTPVAMLHNVGAPNLNEYPGLTLSPAAFESILRLLKRLGYTGIRPTDWLAWRNDGANLPDRPVILVFDDAYAEVAQHAFPLLGKYGFTAACMVPTAFIGSSNKWDEEAGRPSRRLMTATEIREWHEKGIEFGGHSARHHDLGTRPKADVEQEIAQCSRDLTDLLRKPPVSFAYPFGGVNDAARDAALKHFQIAFTVWPGILHLGTDLSLAPRIELPYNESTLGWWFRLRLGKNPIERIKAHLLQLAPR